MKKYKRFIWVVIVALCILVQSVALIKCEILTKKYASDFEFAYKDNAMLGEMESFKVLRCDGQTARVYYVEEGKLCAHVLTFEKINGNWQEDKWQTIWSTTGSASEVIWPYWWHVVYGGL